MNAETPLPDADEPRPDEPGAEAVTPPQKSPRRAMAAAVLSLEAITVGLSTPVMISVEGVDKTAALWAGLGLAVACVVLAGMLRRPWAYVAGHVLQVVAVGLGFFVPTMFVLGGIFAALWFLAIWLANKIERERAEAWAAYEAERARG